MAFSAAELANLANTAIDYHERGEITSQIKQARPLYADLVANKKKFPGGKEYITTAVKGVYTSRMVGYEHDDEQEYVNPVNVKRAQAKWYETGAGITVTYTELKKDGIIVVDDGNFSGSSVSEAELVQLNDILADKIEDITEGSYRSLHEMFWRDGTQDAKAIPGIQSFILTSPSTGVSFGIDRSLNSWWRNRAPPTASAPRSRRDRRSKQSSASRSSSLARSSAGWRRMRQTARFGQGRVGPAT